MKSAKFLIAENPIVNDGRIFIVHMQDPVIIAQAFHFEIDQEEDYLEVQRHFTTGATVNYPDELIFLGARFIAYEKDPERTIKIMSRMGDWYHNFLKWEDSQ